jgi:hypothetical protein
MKIQLGPHTLEQIGGDDGIFVFTMNNGENAFNNESLGHYNEMLDIIERYNPYFTKKKKKKLITARTEVHPLMQH